MHSLLLPYFLFCCFFSMFFSFSLVSLSAPLVGLCAHPALQITTTC